MLMMDQQSWLVNNGQVSDKSVIAESLIAKRLACRSSLCLVCRYEGLVELIAVASLLPHQAITRIIGTSCGSDRARIYFSA